MSKTNKGIFFGKWSSMTIAKKTTLLYGGIFSLSLLAVSLFVLLNVNDLQRSSIRRELYQTISNIESYVTENDSIDDQKLTELLDNKYVEVGVYDTKEKKMYTSYIGEVPLFMEGGGKFNFPPEPMPGDMENIPEDFRNDWKDYLIDRGYRVYQEQSGQEESVTFTAEGETGQQLMLSFKRVHTNENEYLIMAFKMLSGNTNAYFFRTFLLKLVAVDIIGIFCAFLVGRYISRRILMPMERIRSMAERISIEDLSQRLTTDGPDDEMKELTITFNSMIERLDASFQKQNRFVSDASHELRTPISVIQGYANLINRWGKSDSNILQESIDSILSETEHMSALIKQLLFLAKGDQKKVIFQKTEVSLTEAAGELYKELELLDVNREITLEAQEDVNVYADADLLKQLFWIHGENAVKYTSEGGKIQIKVWKDKKYAYLSIQDDGIGISEENLSFIFDRFFRADKSRNKEIPGTGLGLSIAKWIMDCHDGEILVSSKEGEGTCFTDRFYLPFTEEAKKGKKKS